VSGTPRTRLVLAPTRRELLSWSVAGAGTALVRPGGVRREFPVPADKGFSPAWLAALRERGAPTILRGRELRFVGLPVGGIGCGQLYLGGDGRLWHWDLFNQPCAPGANASHGPHYAKPLEPGASPLRFSLSLARRGGGAALSFGPSSFPEIEFRGTWPIGTVRYARQDLEIELEAFSPFAPSELEDSSLPATVLAYRLKNRGTEELAVTLRGTLENLVCRASDDGTAPLVRRTRALESAAHRGFEHAVELELAPGARPDVLFEDFERPAYEGWTVEGRAFGSGPVVAAEMPDYQGRVGAEGARLANSHHTRGGEDIPAGDAHVGTLTSREFTIEREWITLLLGGGAHPGGTGIELLVEGEVAGALTGRNENRLTAQSLYVGAWAGKKARLVIHDRVTGGWGNVGVDSIVFSDRPRIQPLLERGDHGTLALGILGDGAGVELQLPSGEALDAGSQEAGESGSLARTLRLAPGASGTITFVLAWHFPVPWRDSLGFLAGIETRRRHYAARFADAAAVLAEVAGRAEELLGRTRLWRDTWHDSTLPHWFLERTFANNSTLATATAYRFDDGRFYGWEGVYCCPGTCTHVWQYAHGPARLFPSLERDQRERVDFGLAFRADSGQIDYRAEAARELAVDGQAGTILRAYREHTMCADDAFLRRLWPRVKKALELLLARDPDQDGILDGAQYNTLDTAWWGKIAWTSSLYLAAVRAGEAMAEELGDGAFAARCRAVRERGAQAIVRELFNGEYFVHRVDPAHPESNSTGDGCHIDQVFGQSWAHQVGLGRVLPEAETRSALRALWTYSFAPDIGPYRKYMEDKIAGGRWYALPSEAGLLMCTWPKGGEQSAIGKGQDAWAVGYFNECMSGFEYQVAAHMLHEGLVTEGLAVVRAIHDRYAPLRRNPYNEVECGDHYARAMASHGVYLAACGFEIHGPKGHLGFAPRLTPEDFRCAFVGPEGWGSYAQKAAEEAFVATLELRHGRLRLVTLLVGGTARASARTVRARVGERVLEVRGEARAEGTLVEFAEPLVLAAGDKVTVELVG